VAGGLLIGVPWLLAVLWFFETGASRNEPIGAAPAPPRAGTNA
jgi:hypothetical protein